MDELSLSIVVCVRNGRPYLRGTVDALLADQPADSEILIIDDGSTDGGIEDVRELPVKIFTLSGSGNLAAARNFAIRQVRGQYVAFFDQDDVPVIGAMASRLNWLKSHPGELAVAGSMAGALLNGNESLDLAMVFGGRRVTTDRLTFSYFERAGYFPKSLWLFMFSREVFAMVGHFDPSWKLLCDYDYLLRCVRHFSIPVQEIAVAHYRIHATNHTVGCADGKFYAHPRAQAEVILLNQVYGIGDRFS